MKTATMILAAAALTLSATGAFAEDAVTADTIVASVNGTDITVGHVIALRGRLPEQYQALPDETLFPGIVEQLIQHTVLMKAMEAQIDKRIELGLENETRALLAGEMLARLSEREVTEDEIKAAYAEQYDAAIPESEYNASHILVETEDEAKALIRLLEDGADFATLARENSTGPSGPNGGELGWFGAGMMVQPFEEAVMSLAVGEVSSPVQTQFGWHVVRLNDMRNIDIPSLDDVRADLTMELQRNALEAEVERLMGAAEITRAHAEIDPSVIRDVSLFDE